MRSRWERLGALAVALAVVTGGVSALAAQPAAAAPVETRGAGIDAPAMYRLQETTDDTTRDGAEAETATDAAEDAAENETAESAEHDAAEAPGDEAIDGIDCVQQGEHEGENEDC